MSLEKLTGFVPTAKSFVKAASKAPVKFQGKWKTVEELVSDQMRDIQRNTGLSNSEKFKEFIGNFLYVQIRSETADKIREYLRSRFTTPDELANTDATSLIAEFRRIGYRFPDKARMLIKISGILCDQFNGSIDDYVTFVSQNYDKDPMLKVTGVGFKTRDIALSSLTPKYSIVDVHISNVLSRTGLILRAYLYGFKLTTDKSDKKNYLEMTKLLTSLSEEAEMMPFEFDQTLWFFGRDFCSHCSLFKNRKGCPIEKCITRDFRDFIN